jgi:hypothetical protein
MLPRLRLSVPGSERLVSNWKCFGASILLCFFFSLVVGCVTSTSFSNKALLDFLEDGKTSKESVFLKLGQPTGAYNGERIITYKVGGDKEKGYFILDRAVGWTDSKYSLVLVFDEDLILRRHSLVQVR